MTTFLRKTIFGPSPQAALGLLLAVPFEVMRGYCSKIVCVTESRMDFTTAVDLFKGELRSLFSLFRYGDASQLAFFPAELRTPIMHAGRSQTRLRMTYDGVQRLVEPYSLAFKWRKGGTGQEYLYVWDQTDGRSSGPGIKSLFNWKITSAESTDIKFEPRFEIEPAKAGEYGERTMFSSSRRSGVLPSTRPRAQTPYFTRYAAPTASVNSTRPAHPRRCAKRPPNCGPMHLLRLRIAFTRRRDSMRETTFTFLRGFRKTCAFSNRINSAFMSMETTAAATAQKTEPLVGLRPASAREPSLPSSWTTRHADPDPEPCGLCGFARV